MPFATRPRGYGPCPRYAIKDYTETIEWTDYFAFAEYLKSVLNYDHETDIEGLPMHDPGAQSAIGMGESL
jgi:hypothetical protein